ncbi:hypothetical protein RRG08_032763 [Elysia crispata]|uniref:Uncharacterized protein n=1 Tax=Elysia crispata TaxID=231223 RepID=A0AAE0YNV7_9GAST|nr:hypothetical protein RRG08_032763 [Elysia crispata]
MNAYQAKVKNQYENIKSLPSQFPGMTIKLGFGVNVVTLVNYYVIECGVRVATHISRGGHGERCHHWSDGQIPPMFPSSQGSSVTGQDVSCDHPSLISRGKRFECRSGGDPRRQPSVQTGACDERLVSRGPLDGDSTSVGAAHAPAVSWTGGSGNECEGDGQKIRVVGKEMNCWSSFRLLEPVVLSSGQEQKNGASEVTIVTSSLGIFASMDFTMLQR